MHMTEHAQRVAKFMRLAGQEIPEKPTVPSADVRILRAKLILEEALETVNALGVEVAGWHFDSLTFADLQFYDNGKPDLIEIADGCADISVVTIGTLLACGIADDAVLREVDESNLRKFGPGSGRRKDGKWMKPADWTPPDLAKVLAEQATQAETDRTY